MSGWRYVKDDTAWHYFHSGQSACGIFTITKHQFTAGKPNLLESCAACLNAAPAASFELKDNDGKRTTGHFKTRAAK